MVDITGFLKRYLGNREIESQSPKLSLWEQWYKGYNPSFHDYKIYNGFEYVKLVKKNLGIAKKSCEDWANLLLNEKCDIIVKDKEELDELLKENSFWSNGNRLIELTFALGTGAFVESIDNLIVNDDGIAVKSNESKIKISYINATKIYPLTFRDGEIVECAFASQNTDGANVVIHLLNDNGEYDVVNIVLDKSGNEIVEKGYTFHSGSKKPLYQILKPNIVNNIDFDSPLGISVFANSIDTLEAIDNAYDSFDTEIQYGRRRILVDEKFINFDADGNSIPAFDKNDIVFYRMPEREDGKPIIEDISSPLRTMDIANSLQEQLNTYASMVGFGKNYYSFGASGGGRPIQTATGIIAQNSDLFRSIKKHEILLEKVLVDLVEMLEYLHNTFLPAKVDFKNPTVKFDDSIIEDKESEKTSDRTDLSNGVISKAEYRMKWYGEDEETAKENIEKFSLDDLDVRLNSLLTALQSGAITPEEFVDAVYKDRDEDKKREITEYIIANKDKADNPINLDVLGVDVNE